MQRCAPFALVARGFGSPEMSLYRTRVRGWRLGLTFLTDVAGHAPARSLLPRMRRQVGGNRNYQVGQSFTRRLVFERARGEECAVPYAWELLEASPRFCRRRKQNEAPHRMASDHLALRNPSDRAPVVFYG